MCAECKKLNLGVKCLSRAKNNACSICVYRNVVCSKTAAEREDRVKQALHIDNKTFKMLLQAMEKENGGAVNDHENDLENQIDGSVSVSVHVLPKANAGGGESSNPTAGKRANRKNKSKTAIVRAFTELLIYYV